MTKFYKPYAPHEIDELPEEIKGRLKETIREKGNYIDTLVDKINDLNAQLDGVRK